MSRVKALIACCPILLAVVSGLGSGCLDDPRPLDGAHIATATDVVQLAVGPDHVYWIDAAQEPGIRWVDKDGRFTALVEDVAESEIRLLSKGDRVAFSDASGMIRRIDGTRATDILAEGVDPGLWTLHGDTVFALAGDEVLAHRAGEVEVLGLSPCVEDCQLVDTDGYWVYVYDAVSGVLSRAAVAERPLAWREVAIAPGLAQLAVGNATAYWTSATSSEHRVRGLASEPVSEVEAAEIGCVFAAGNRVLWTSGPALGVLSVGGGQLRRVELPGEASHCAADRDASYVVAQVAQEQRLVRVVHRSDTRERVIVSLGGDGAGRVISTPTGIDCGATCDASFGDETIVLRAEPDDGSFFAGWPVEGCGQSATCTLSLEAARQLDLSFVRLRASVEDTVRAEGAAAEAEAVLVVALNGPPPVPIDVRYQTLDGTAIAGVDYRAVEGVLRFEPGQLTGEVRVPLLGNRRSQPDRELEVHLTVDDERAVLERDAARVVIRDDDSGPDFDGDGFGDVVVGARLDDAHEADAGAVYVYYGRVTPVSRAADDADLIIVGGTAGDQFGIDVATGDVNGDGVDDLVVGASRARNLVLQEVGAAYVFFGSGQRRTGVLGVDAADAVILSDDPGGQFGTRLAADDLDADGCADLLIGAREYTGSVSNSGAAFVFFGCWDVRPSTVSSADLRLYGPRAGSFFGYAIASAGDFDGDGLDDLLIGARSADPLPDGDSAVAGAAFLFTGGSMVAAAESGQPVIFAADADITFMGSILGGGFGYSVGGNIDFNGDGFSDIVVGAPYQQWSQPGDGAAYVFLGGPAVVGPLLDDMAELQVRGQGRMALGFSVDGVGDTDGDGLGDVVIGARLASPGNKKSAGAAYLFHGTPASASQPVSVAAADVAIDGTWVDGFLGSFTSGEVDVDRDGLHDFLVGATDAGPDDAGRAYLLLGKSLLPQLSSADADAVFSGAGPSSEFGHGLH